MTKIQLITNVYAPIEICFDLSLDIDFHKKTMSHTNEKAIAGRTNGIIELNEEVTWHGKHLGTYHTHTSKITKWERPFHFRDQMIKGRFKSFVHDHYFENKGDYVQIKETLEFTSPFWPFSILIEKLILKPYLTKLLINRNVMLKATAESKP